MGEQQTRLYRIADIIGDRKRGIPAIIPISRTSWYTGIKNGTYPAPVRLSERSVAWRSSDIDALISRLGSGDCGTAN